MATPHTLTRLGTLSFFFAAVTILTCTTTTTGVARLLLDAGAEVDARDMRGSTPLDVARSAGMVALLENNGAVSSLTGLPAEP